MRVSLPVAPYVASVGKTDNSAGKTDNVVLSLLGIAPPEHIRLPVTPPTTPGNFLEFTLEIADVQTMLDVGFSGAVTFQSKIEAQTFYWISDLANFQVVPNNDDQSVIVEATYSVGMRLGIFATNLSTSMSLNAFTIAARGELHTSSTAYQVLVLGAGLETISALKPLIANSTAPFTVETIQVIGAVQAEINGFLADGASKGKLAPVLSRVTIDTARLSHFSTAGVTSDLLETSKAFTFALERSYRSKNADDAAKGAAEHGVDPAVVRQAYEELLGLRGADPVTAAALKTTADIIFAGRI